MASIKGLQKTTLVDFPPYVACTLFISSCNFRCNFCQNPELVNDSKDIKEISEQEIFDFLDKRNNVLDAVCITGGEPLLYKNLKNFIGQIKEHGFKVKLDTNGTIPSLLKELVDEGLVDYVAMDIKTSLDGYDKAAGVKVDKEKIKESVKLLMENKVDYEFRMTVVPGLVDKEDIEKIGEWLKGADKFFIQQFRNKSCLDKSFEKIKPFSEDKLKEFKEVLDKHIDKVEVRA